MKIFSRSVLVSFLLLIAAPAFSDVDMSAVQIFECEFNGDAGASDLFEVTAAWLTAAKNTEGGENVDVAIRFPIAEGGDAGGDFRFVIIFPSFAEWGAFTDAYEGSDVEIVDADLFDIADCGQSTMWEGIHTL
jgi:hypothetical protein